jgi:hypothetical protein
MSAIYINGPASSALARMHLEPGNPDHDEKWLQKLVFDYPALIPLEEIEPGAGDFVPLCRELGFNQRGTSVFLDILGVTRSGRLALVECKLWRNPQARREVIAQTLEYASLLRRLSYSDLTAKLAGKGLTGSNPIFDAASSRWPELHEAAFVDAVSRSLKRGDFHLFVAGDGIRSDLHSISEHLEFSGLAAARFSLVEMQLWKDADGAILVVPTVPVRTEIIRHRVLVTESGDIARLEEVRDEERASTDDPARAANRIFWQSFIDTVKFDHPDQPKPRHGGNNWVGLSLPSGSITVFRSKAEEVGFVLKGPLARFADRITSEIGLPATEKDGVVVLSARQSGEENQLGWLLENTNRLVNLLRPLLSDQQA